MGPLALDDFHHSKKKTTVIDKNLYRIEKGFPNTVNDFFLVGGCWRALARINMNINGYPLKVLQGYETSVESLNETLDFVFSAKISELAKITSSSMESNRSRFPGFGEVLFTWLRPIFPDMNEIEERLYLAACLLHDTIWQAHPDYRSEVCFETVTGANLGGIDHEGRVFLALSLMSRYKRTDLNKLNKGILNLLDRNSIRKAIILGASMRLGSMLSVTIASNLQKTKIFIKEKNIYLSLKEKDGFLGETVEKRLNHLAKLMNLNPKIIVE